MNTKSLPNIDMGKPELTNQWVMSHLKVTEAAAKVLIRWIRAEKTSQLADNTAELSAARSDLKKLGSEWKLLKRRMESSFLR